MDVSITLVREYFMCPRHHKRTYPSRKAAKRAARATYEPGLREYPCSRYEGHWHNGHTPPMVIRGELTADEFYALPSAVQRFFWMIEEQYGEQQRRGRAVGDAARRRAGVPPAVPARTRAKPGRNRPAHRDEPGDDLAFPDGPMGDLAHLDGGPDRDRPGSGDVGDVPPAAEAA